MLCELVFVFICVCCWRVVRVFLRAVPYVSERDGMRVSVCQPMVLMLALLEVMVNAGSSNCDIVLAPARRQVVNVCWCKAGAPTVSSHSTDMHLPVQEAIFGSARDSRVVLSHQQFGAEHVPTGRSMHCILRHNP
jgi:hypothetical protein